MVDPKWRLCITMQPIEIEGALSIAPVWLEEAATGLGIMSFRSWLLLVSVHFGQISFTSKV